MFFCNGNTLNLYMRTLTLILWITMWSWHCRAFLFQLDFQLDFHFAKSLHFELLTTLYNDWHCRCWCCWYMTCLILILNFSFVLQLCFCNWCFTYILHSNFLMSLMNELTFNLSLIYNLINLFHMLGRCWVVVLIDSIELIVDALCWNCDCAWWNDEIYLSCDNFDLNSIW